MAESVIKLRDRIVNYPDNNSFGPIYGEKITASTSYTFSEYPSDSVFLVSYSNGGLLMITKWSDTSLSMNIIHASDNSITPSVSGLYLTLTLGQGVSSQIAIIRLK